jgi:hypothetical protein
MNELDQILFEAIKVACAGIAGGLIGARANDKFTRKRERERDLENRRLRFREFLIGWRLEIASVQNGGRMGCIPKPQFETRRVQLRSDAKGVKNAFVDGNEFDRLVEIISSLDLAALEQDRKTIPQQAILDMIDALIEFTA